MDQAPGHVDTWTCLGCVSSTESINNSCAASSSINKLPVPLTQCGSLPYSGSQERLMMSLPATRRPVPAGLRSRTEPGTETFTAGFQTEAWPGSSFHGNGPAVHRLIEKWHFLLWLVETRTRTRDPTGPADQTCFTLLCSYYYYY